MATPAPPPRRSSERELRKLKPFQNQSRNTSSAMNDTTPAMMTATTIMRTSPLRIWVSSWPSTDSISASLSRPSRPDVTVIEYCF
jgi:hypothetical protein